MTNDVFIYWLTFRLTDSIAARRIRRYEKLVDFIENDDTGIALSFWNEPTSFYVFETVFSPEAIADLLRHIIDVKKDIVMFQKVGFTRHYVVGTPEDEDGLGLLPDVKIFPIKND